MTELNVRGSKIIYARFAVNRGIFKVKLKNSQHCDFESHQTVAFQDFHQRNSAVNTQTRNKINRRGYQWDLTLSF